MAHTKYSASNSWCNLLSVWLSVGVSWPVNSQIVMKSHRASCVVWSMKHCWKLLIVANNFVKQIPFNFMVNTVLAYSLTLIGAITSAGTLMTKYESHIFTRPALTGLISLFVLELSSTEMCQCSHTGFIPTNRSMICPPTYIDKLSSRVHLRHWFFVYRRTEVGHHCGCRWPRTIRC